MPIEVINTKKPDGPVTLELLPVGAFFTETEPGSDRIFIKTDIVLLGVKVHVLVFKDGSTNAKHTSMDMAMLVRPVSNVSIKFEV